LVPFLPPLVRVDDALYCNPRSRISLTPFQSTTSPHSPILFPPAEHRNLPPLIRTVVLAVSLEIDFFGYPKAVPEQWFKASPLTVRQLSGFFHLHQKGLLAVPVFYAKS